MHPLTEINNYLDFLHELMDRYEAHPDRDRHLLTYVKEQHAQLRADLTRLGLLPSAKSAQEE